MNILSRSFLAAGACMVAAVFCTAAQAGSTNWGISLNIPLGASYPQYPSTTYSSSAYGPIESYTQTPQTVCTTQWTNGYPREVCSTEYVRIPEYAPPRVVYGPPVVYAPPSVIIQGNSPWGYSGYRPAPPRFYGPPPPRYPEPPRWEGPRYRPGPGSLGIHGGDRPPRDRD